MNELISMLAYMRPAGSSTEREFIRRFIRPTGAQPDPRGNYLLRIGDAPVAWCSHTDTVHHWGGRQPVEVVKGVARVTGSNCLGADDTTGVWLMLEMIRADVPGLYIFHRAEERGCLGSSYIAKHTPELLDGIDAAIAFDRRGFADVLTHQMGERTASNAFAWSLADQLPKGYRPDDGGVYTDTYEYAHIVPECTNISVGYGSQHSAAEWQDLAFAAELRDYLIQIDPDRLIFERDPSVYESQWAGGLWGGVEYDEPLEEDDELGCVICLANTGGRYLIHDQIVCRPCFDVLTYMREDTQDA